MSPTVVEQLCTDEIGDFPETPFRSNFLAYQTSLGLSGGCEQNAAHFCGKNKIKLNIVAKIPRGFSFYVTVLWYFLPQNAKKFNLIKLHTKNF